MSERGVEIIPAGDLVTITVRNHESVDLHIGLLVIDAEGEVTVLHPPASDDVDSDIVAAGKKLQLGPLRAVAPFGLTELLVIASTHSLRGALKTLRRVATARRGPETAVDPDEVMRDVFAVLDSRRGVKAPVVLAPGPRPIDVRQVAALSLLYEVVPQAT
ncbi:MAG: DUF4384 domain-containing protein [Cyanothece sp. SIO1E1]|nr:DUF4384 domain-containing protein [Cyanothece sp. SIO1E1]